MYRRERLIVAVLVVFALLFWFYPSHIDNIRDYASTFHTQLDPWKPPKHNGPGLKIALVNTPRYHFEVVTPLLYALANQGDAVDKLVMYATEYGSTRLGVRPILDNQLPQDDSWSQMWKGEGPKQHLRVIDPPKLSEMDFVPDLMIFVSCSRDLEVATLKDKRIFNPEWYRAPKEIVCMIHEAEEWQNPDTPWRRMLMPWIERGRVTFLVLSPHVGEYVKTNIERDWHMAPILRDSQVIGVKGVFLADPFIPVFEDHKFFDEQMFSNITGPYAAIPVSNNELFLELSGH